MKPTSYLLFFFCLYYINNAYCQDYEISSQLSPIESGEVIEVLDNGEVFIGGQAGGPGGTSPCLYKVDSLGNIELFAEIPSEGTNNSVIDIASIDSTIYVLTTFFACDYVGEITLYKINSSGESSLVWLWNGSDESSIAVVNDSLLVWVIDDDLIQISPSGRKYETLPFNARDIIPITDSSALIVGDGGYEYRVFSDTTVVTSFEVNREFLKIAKLENDEIMLLHTNGLMQLDDNFLPKASTNFTEDGNYFDVIGHEGDTYVLCKNGIESIIKKFDSTLNFIEDYYIGGEFFELKDFELKNDRVILTGFQLDGISNYYYSSSLWLKSNSIENINNPERPDIGISNIYYLDFVTSGFECIWTDQQPSLRDCAIEEIILTVKNYGTEPVNKFNVNALFQRCMYICSRPDSFLESFSEIDLQPGEEIEIYLGTLDFPSLVVKEGGSYDLCFWTSVPDGKIDGDLSNNRFCKTIENIPIGINEASITNQISVFPNPAKESVVFEFSIAENTSPITFYNELGQVVLQEAIRSGEKLDLSKLVSGIYFWKLGKESGKLIIQ